MGNICTVEDMFQWKISNRNAESVESINSDFFDTLKWNDHIDVLYSFLLFYKLGLIVENEERFYDLKGIYKKKNKLERLNDNSAKFLYFCSHDPVYADLNNSQDYKDFFILYFSIGNVIPIWPGGNEARGKMGLYDIPELFFRIYSDWTNRLVELYPNACIDGVINANGFMISRDSQTGGYKLRGYLDAFSSLGQFLSLMKKNRQLYYDYLKHRNDVIRMRLNYLNEQLGIKQ